MKIVIKKVNIYSDSSSQANKETKPQDSRSLSDVSEEDLPPGLKEYIQANFPGMEVMGYLKVEKKATTTAQTIAERQIKFLHDVYHGVENRVDIELLLGSTVCNRVIPYTEILLRTTDRKPGGLNTKEALEILCEYMNVTLPKEGTIDFSKEIIIPKEMGEEIKEKH